MPQAEKKRAGNEFQQRALTAPWISSGESTPLRTMQAPHSWTVPLMRSEGQGKRGLRAQSFAGWVRQQSPCDIILCLALEAHLASNVRNLMWINWTEENNTGFVWQTVTQHTEANVNTLESHQSYSDHFPDTTNKGTHSLSVYHEMTTKVIQSFLLRCHQALTKA